MITLSRKLNFAQKKNLPVSDDASPLEGTLIPKPTPQVVDGAAALLAKQFVIIDQHPDGLHTIANQIPRQPCYSAFDWVGAAADSHERWRRSQEKDIMTLSEAKIHQRMQEQGEKSLYDNTGVPTDTLELGSAEDHKTPASAAASSAPNQGVTLEIIPENPELKKA